MKILKNYYPQLLVILQFGIIGIMLLLMRHFINSVSTFILFGLGAILGLWALRHNQVGNFNIQPTLKEQGELITTGIYRYIRHPMYLSVLLMMLSVVIANPTIVQGVLFLMLIMVLWLKALREESLWVAHHLEYQNYQKKTKFFIPFIL